MSQAKEAEIFTSIRSWELIRPADGILGGVLAGVGRKINLAPAPTRLIFIVAALLVPPLLLVAYALAWAFLPDSRGNIVIQNFGRGITNLGALSGILVLLLAALITANLRMPWIPPTLAMTSTMLIWHFLLLIAIALAIAGAAAGAARFKHRRVRHDVTLHADTSADAATPTEPAPVRVTEDAVESDTEAPIVAPAEILPPLATANPNPAPGATRSPLPRRPRKMGPGRPMYLVFFAWLAVAALALLWAGDSNLSVPFWVAYPLLVFVGVGVLITLLAISGRHGGFINLFALLALVPIILLGVGHSAILRDYGTQNRADRHAGIDGFPTPQVTWSSEPAPDYTAFPEIDITDDFFAGQSEFDFTLKFSADYPEVYLSGCVPAAEVASEIFDSGLIYPSSVARVRSHNLTEDRELLLRTETTYLNILPGTNLTIGADPHTPLWVIFRDRDVACLVDSAEQIILTGNAAPTITAINTPDNFQGYQSLLVIHEEYQ